MGALGILAFALAIAASIALHEAGHMFTARAFGMRVRRYFIGFGPTVWSTTKSDTEYGLAALPFGGFCDIAGMTAMDPLTPEEEPHAMVNKPAWQRIAVEKPQLAAEFAPELRDELLEQARRLLSGYYRLEDPTRFSPQSCEQRVEVELADGTLLRGFVDRIDVAPTGELRVVDYKTGRAPSETRALAEAKAMFQMKFYAVALLRSRDVLPARLRLIYLADGQVLDYTPDLDELLRFEKTLMAMWRAIQSAGRTGDFRPKPSRLCDWCVHHDLCPVFGGTPPPYPGWPEVTEPAA